MVYNLYAENFDGSGRFGLKTENLSEVLSLVKSLSSVQYYNLSYDENASMTDSSFNFQYKCSVSRKDGGKDEFVKDLEHLISIGF